MPKVTFMISVLTPNNKMGYFFTEDRYLYIKMISMISEKMPEASVQSAFKPSIRGEKLAKCSTMEHIEHFLKTSKEAM